MPSNERPTPLTHWGQHIQRRLRGAGVSQQDLAKAWGVHPARVTQIMQYPVPTQIPPGRFETLAEFLQIPPADLYRELYEDFSAQSSRDQPTDRDDPEPASENSTSPGRKALFRAVLGRLAKPAEEYSFTIKHGSLSITLSLSDHDPSRQHTLTDLAYACTRVLSNYLQTALQDRDDG